MKLKERIHQLPNEAVGNIILLGFLVCNFIASAITGFLGNSNVFYLALSGKIVKYVLLFQASVVLAFIYAIFATNGQVLTHGRFKYTLLFTVYIWIGIDCTVLYFHSTLLLLIPLIISRCYNSRRVTLHSIYATICLIIATPLLAYKFDRMDVTFPMWYVSVIEAKLGDKVPDLNWMVSTPFNENTLTISPYLQILLWVVLPRLITVFGLVLVALAGNYASRKSYSRQVEHIRGLQDSMIDSMANVVENRDSSTGGHVRRTQDNVKILVSNLRKEIKMPDEYWNNVIKSSAMHDLGKIAISDKILTKPGRLTEEEFEQIKIHPEKSKNIIDKLFENENDDELKTIAGNIALYHHEKYDGSGYPKGLQGEEIPLEARIMAISDVYDALVSERCYKEAYSFEEAYDVVEKSMGKHFDPQLWNAFKNSVPMLEEYYTKLKTV